MAGSGLSWPVQPIWLLKVALYDTTFITGMEKKQNNEKQKPVDPKRPAGTSDSNGKM